MMKFLDGIDK